MTSSSVLPLGDLAIDHEAEPLLEGECVSIRLSQLIVESLGHAGEAQRDEPFVAVIDEHEVSFLQVSECRALWEARYGGSWKWHHDVKEWQVVG